MSSFPLSKTEQSKQAATPKFGLELLTRLPTALLTDLLSTYLGIASLSALGQTCRTLADYRELWLLLYKLNTGRQNSMRNESRSSNSPRASYFSSVRLQNRQAIHRLVVQMRSSFDKGDSPSKVKNIYEKEVLLIKGEELRVEQLVGDLMIYAAYRGRWRSVKAFIENKYVSVNHHSPQTSIVFSLSTAHEASALIIAAWTGNSSFVQWLLNWSQEKVNLLHRAGLAQTSACGGVGPFTAREWAERKATACPQVPSFRKCAALLKAAEAAETEGVLLSKYTQKTRSKKTQPQ